MLLHKGIYNNFRWIAKGINVLQYGKVYSPFSFE